jgi:hypothetical protein
VHIATNFPKTGEFLQFGRIVVVLRISRTNVVVFLELTRPWCLLVVAAAGACLWSPVLLRLPLLLPIPHRLRRCLLPLPFAFLRRRLPAATREQSAAKDGRQRVGREERDERIGFRAGLGGSRGGREFFLVMKKAGTTTFHRIGGTGQFHISTEYSFLGNQSVPFH